MKLTREDIRKIQEEIDFRKGTHRTELLENLKSARSLGDLSENFEYSMAKRANNQNNSRIAYLERMIRTAEIIEDTAPDDVVGLNKEVTIYIPEDDETAVYKIVSSIRGDSTKGRISTDSPLGKALAGRRTGDVVTVRVNEFYSYDAQIRNVVAIADDGTDEIRQY